MRFTGDLFRALNPVYARDPLSGEGARRYGGRFNPKGVPALYTSLTTMTALHEGHQVGRLQPITLVSYEADLDPVFDTREAAAMEGQGMTAADLAVNDWRVHMLAEGEAPTQRFARKLIGQGYAGLLVRSFAPGTTVEDLNIVLWAWGADLPTRLILTDDERRLA